MPAERLSMRKVREVLRLKYGCGASARVIAQSIGIGRTAVAEYTPGGGDRHHLADPAQAVRAGRLQSATLEATARLGRIHAELRRRGT
jgi:hypothetical protein